MNITRLRIFVFVSHTILWIAFTSIAAGAYVDSYYYPHGNPPTEIKQVWDTEQLEMREIERRIELVAKAGAEDGLTGQLVLAADQFIVGRGEGKTVIAGYHWFSDWGRDTMIALNGLTLVTGRPDIAKSILIEFSRSPRQVDVS